jgi:hypothetical protein
MSAILLLVCLFLLCLLFCELLLQRAKLQTRFTRILMAHILFAVGGMIFLHRLYGIHSLAVAVFWLGGFLSWFGIRSHVESSILIRMIFLLRQQPMRPEELIIDYKRHYSSALRLEELQRSGLLDRKGNQLQLTKKGECVLRIARLLG